MAQNSGPGEEAISLPRLAPDRAADEAPRRTRFHEYFDLEEIQALQDGFAEATGVASIITEPDGRPITRPSNFCRLCRDIIRQTAIGCANCHHSDAVLGRKRPQGPVVQPCLSGGLMDGGASICVGDDHIANWLIGQVLDESFDEERMVAYATVIGADPGKFREALREVTRMSRAQFRKVGQLLFLVARQISALALQNAVKSQHLEQQSRTQEALRLREAQLRAVVDNIEDIVWLKDRNSRYVLANRAFSRLCGREAPSVVGMLDRELFAADLAERYRADDLEVLQTGEARRLQEQVERLDGTRLWVETIKTPVGAGAGGPPLGTVGIARDISTQVQVAQDRERLLALEQAARHHAEVAVAARDDFLRVASHELKTPLTSLLLSIQSLQGRLKSSDLSPAAREPFATPLERIERQSKRLALLVNELLDVSRISGSRLSLRRESVDLAEVVREVVQRLQPDCQRAGSTIVVLPRSDGPLEVTGTRGWWDRSRLEQVIDNLLSNAIKYGRGRAIELAVGSDGGTAVVEVRDQGIGIAPADQERVFAQFTRAVPESQCAGLGLGLWIARAIVEAHGGRIELSSSVGEGSTFTVLLPRGLGEPPQRSVAPNEGLGDSPCPQR
ncbi:MAG: PocR ligand-binding domain-containing protein [Myxococcales bacterium]